jgi:hypothetical protein
LESKAIEWIRVAGINIYDSGVFDNTIVRSAGFNRLYGRAGCISRDAFEEGVRRWSHMNGQSCGIRGVCDVTLGIDEIQKGLDQVEYYQEEAKQRYIKQTARLI